MPFPDTPILKDPSFQNNRFVKYERIGQGSSGVVYRGANLETGQQVAIKVMNMEDIKNECSSRSLESIRREIRLLFQCSHPHITKYYGSCLAGQSLWIVMEYCGAGSLRQIIDQDWDGLASTRKKDCIGNRHGEAFGGLEEDVILLIAKQILQALVYLHKHNQILHRDIKAANILLSNQDGCVKLGDFGVSVHQKIRQTSKLVGSPYWMAPEVIKGAPYDWRADIWSFGITLIELATGRPPLSHLGGSEAMRKIAQYNIPPKLDKDCFGRVFRHLVKACLQLDPAERLDAESLLRYLRGSAAMMKLGSSLGSLMSPKEKLLRLAQKMHTNLESAESTLSPTVLSPTNPDELGPEWDFEKFEDQATIFRLDSASIGHLEPSMEEFLGSVKARRYDGSETNDERPIDESIGDSRLESLASPLSIGHRNRRYAKSDSDMIILRKPIELEEHTFGHDTAGSSNTPALTNSPEHLSQKARQHHRSSGGSIDQIADFRNDCQLLTKEERDSLHFCMVYGNLVSQAWPVNELKEQLIDSTKIETELLKLYNVRPASPQVLHIALGFIIRSRK